MREKEYPNLLPTKCFNKYINDAINIIHLNELLNIFTSDNLALKTNPKAHEIMDNVTNELNELNVKTIEELKTKLSPLLNDALVLRRKY